MCKISVIVPVYNAARYIEKCLDSIYAQTEKDYEIIIVNDGTKDNSVELVEQWMKNKDVSLKIVSQENRGLPQARRMGIKNALGRYIIFVDSDDWIEPDMLEKLFFKAEETGADIVSCDIMMETDEKVFICDYSSFEEKRLNNVDAMRALHNMSAVYPYMWNKIFRKELLKEIYFPENNFLGEDYCTLTSILEETNMVVHIPNVLYHYVQHKNNMTKSQFGLIYTRAYENYNKRKIYIIEKYPELKRSVINYHILQEMAIINAMIRSDEYDKKMLKNIIKNIRKNLWGYLTDSNVKILHKGSAGVMAVSIDLYRIIFGILDK